MRNSRPAAAGNLGCRLAEAAQRFCIQRLRIDVHSNAGLEVIGERNAEHQGNGRDDLEVDERAYPDPSYLREILGRGDAARRRKTRSREPAS